MRTNRARHPHARCDRSNRLSASLGPQGWHIGRMMDGQTLRRQHTRTKHEPPARWSSRMSLCGHRDRAIDLMAGGREGNWLEKECGDGHREALGLTFSSSAQPSGQGGRRARGYSPHGRCSRRGAKQRTVTSSPPATPRQVLWQWCQRFGGEVP